MNKFSNDAQNLAIQHLADEAARFEGAAVMDWAEGLIGDEEMTAVSERFDRVIAAAVSMGVSRRDLPA